MSGRGWWRGHGRDVDVWIEEREVVVAISKTELAGSYRWRIGRDDALNDLSGREPRTRWPRIGGVAGLRTALK